MERFKNILLVSVGTRGDMTALAKANHLAMSNQARITLVGVVQEAPLAASVFLSRARVLQLQEASEIEARKKLDRMKKHLDGSLRATTKVLAGKPFIELIRAVKTESYDLMIKSRDVTGETSALASTDLHLLRKCPCPIWIVNPRRRKPDQKILIAVDPDPSDPERLRLHADLVELGTSLALKENGKVEVVHAWRLYGESMLLGPRFKLRQAEINEMEKNEKATRQKWLNELVAPYSAGDLKVTLIKGQPDTVLKEIIVKRKPDVVIMGTVSRGGLPGLLIGNTAENVLPGIKCSILTLKPRGFDSPVV